MQVEQINTLFEYHWSTTERLLEIAGQLPEEDYSRKLEYGPGSVHRLIFHLIASNNSWRNALETGTQEVGINAEDYPDPSALKELFIQERDAWRQYLSQLSAEDLNAVATLTSLRGREHTFPLWHVLTHLILHGMQHHSELAQVLTDFDRSPGNIDFIFYTG